MSKIIATVLGNPKPLKRHYHLKTGRAFDPSAKDKKDFAWKVKASPFKITRFKGDIRMILLFYMRRPKNHYRSGKLSRILKDTAPVYHRIKPDISNLIKFVEDALNGICYDDDSQIVKIESTKKYVLDYDDIPRTVITIEEI